MSTFAMGVLSAKRQTAEASTSTKGSPPGVSTYVDALAALVPAEALSLHAVILGFTTSTSTTSPKVTTIADPSTLRWAFCALIVLCPILFLAGRSAGSAKGWGNPWITVPQALIPSAAFVAWTMLQKTTAFDAVDAGLSTGARDTIAVIAAVVLGLLAGMLGYKLDSQPTSPSQ